MARSSYNDRGDGREITSKAFLAPSSTLQVDPLEDFPLFAKFPIEVRRMVFREALPRPRVIAFDSWRASAEELEFIGSINSRDIENRISNVVGPITEVHLPNAMFVVNRESREVALDNYTLISLASKYPV
ncbi:uncharacterized protein LY89DRAFT_731781 [Mollisia scopiformis]|uniref:2EXR domain-containing protein n=1 Tax=Mollisia scopiformis TaxID=149040 RepID=A0A194XHY6_MOLSC|nr:uncharacterized protein LY89DRAFT_731781 [Mollisia scopiformis]KUJ19382.1 hypothetical protein LY89DRAFT_731781 [Mollisia scopiformis]